MTKKHFEAIAAIIRQNVKDVEEMEFSQASDAAYVTLQVQAKQFAEYFASENPRFDREKFLTACGL